MRSALLLFAIFSSLCECYSQELEFITLLDSGLHENSGLILLNNRLISFQDSGNEPLLLEIDSVNGEILRTVFIDNATNIDWEDICYDEENIFIGDLGNNDGNRTNLCVCKLTISDYLNTPNDTVSDQVINFSYQDQTDFSLSTWSTIYDAESLISYNDSLYIFTKN